MPPRPRPRPAERAAPLLARVAPQAARWVERSLGEHSPPLTVAQYLALERLDRGEANASALAEDASVSRSAVSQLVASLEDLGLLERGGGEDRRLQTLRLSGAGRRTLRSARRLLDQRLGSLLSGLPGPERDRLARSLQAVEDALQGKAPPRRPRAPRPPRRR
jgi:DNA-binding MarR family transcriptional regulator